MDVRVTTTGGQSAINANDQFTYQAIPTVTSLTVLGVIVSSTSVPAGIANVLATAVGAVPSFELNRRWVWQRTGRRSVRNELAPFWLLSLAGLASRPSP